MRYTYCGLKQEESIQDYIPESTTLRASIPAVKEAFDALGTPSTMPDL